MNVEIPCELYIRFAEIAKLLDPQDKRKYFRSLYIERKNNQLFIVATNVKVAAIEYLRSEGPDESTAIAVDDALIAQCEKEIQFNSNLHITANPALKFTAIKTSFGYNHALNCHVELPAKCDFHTWRDWFPDALATKTNGAMFWGMQALYGLAQASKSGGLVFPEFIDTSLPVVVNDSEANNWVGLFMPTTGGAKTTPATIPDWIEK